jgi:glutaminase
MFSPLFPHALTFLHYCSLNQQGLPHNPLVNAGAIAMCSLIMPEDEPSDRFEFLKTFLERLSGGYGTIGFDNGFGFLCANVLHKLHKQTV